MALWSKKPAATEVPAAAAPSAAVPPPAPLPETQSAEPAPAAVDPAASTSALSADELDRRRQMSRQISATFGEIVSLLMRQGSTKHQTLADLEWLVLPALAANQFSVAEAQSKAQGFMTPIALVLWARVSPEVDQRLGGDLDRPIRLTPAEWTSGDRLWLVEAIGEPRTLQNILQRLAKTRWQGQLVKFRSRDKTGRVVVHQLTSTPPSEATAG